MTVATVHRSLFAAAAVLGLAASAFAQAALPLSAEKAALVSVTAKVQAIDQTTREVTLKGPLGNTITFTVDKRVARLNEVKVGDEVTADYYVSVAAEVRQPTDAEKATPMAVLKETAKAPAGTEPAAGVLHITKAVVTIEGLDRPTKCVTVMGPKGNLATIEVADVANLPKLRIGDTVIVTYTEALAVSLQKRPAK
jgi:Cu/Ag efflux protein CusF